MSTFTLFAIGALMASMSGALAFFLPAVLTAFASTGQAVTPAPVPGLGSPSPAAQVGPFTVLLLGSDDDQKFDPNHVLTQSMILVRVVPATQQVTMLSIPRDLWVPLSTGGTAKIDGANALQYVRSRHGDLEGDFGRSQRQQQVLLAIRERAKHITVADIPALAVTFNGELKTSMGIARIQQLLPLAAALTNPDAVRQIVLLSPYTTITDIDNQSVVVPHWNLILPLVHQYFP